MADDNRILCKAIIQMVGAPKEHIEATLKDYVTKLKEDKDKEFVNEEYMPAEKNEDDQFFSCFAELDIWMKNIDTLINFSFYSMPASIEILEPEEFKLNSAEFSNILNTVQNKLHNIDMTVKQLRAQNTLMNEKLTTSLKNMITLVLSSGPKDAAELAKLVGVSEEAATKLASQLASDGRIENINNKYSLKSKHD